MSKTRMIGIKVSANSPLPERLKALSLKLKMDYEQLLEKWIISEEQPGQLKLFSETDEPIVKPKDLQLNPIASEVKLFEARLAAMEEQISKITGFLTTETEENSDLVEPEVKPNRREVKPELNHETIILELSREGLSTRQIAARLNSEGIKTATGLENWNHGVVGKILKRLNRG